MMIKRVLFIFLVVVLLVSSLCVPCFAYVYQGERIFLSDDNLFKFNTGFITQDIFSKFKTVGGSSRPYYFCKQSDLSSVESYRQFSNKFTNIQIFTIRCFGSYSQINSFIDLYNSYYEFLNNIPQSKYPDNPIYLRTTSESFFPYIPFSTMSEYESLDAGDYFANIGISGLKSISNSLLKKYAILGKDEHVYTTDGIDLGIFYAPSLVKVSSGTKYSLYYYSNDSTLDITTSSEELYRCDFTVGFKFRNLGSDFTIGSNDSYDYISYSVGDSSCGLLDFLSYALDNQWTYVVESVFFRERNQFFVPLNNNIYLPQSNIIISFFDPLLAPYFKARGSNWPSSVTFTYEVGISDNVNMNDLYVNRYITLSQDQNLYNYEGTNDFYYSCLPCSFNKEGFYSFAYLKYSISGNAPFCVAPQYDFITANSFRVYSALVESSEVSSSIQYDSVTGSDYYREPSNWFDIPTYLYNFVIWFCVDSPLISDIMRPVFTISSAYGTLWQDVFIPFIIAGGVLGGFIVFVIIILVIKRIMK